MNQSIRQLTSYGWKCKLRGMDANQLKRNMKPAAELSSYKKIVAEQTFIQGHPCTLHTPLVISNLKINRLHHASSLSEKKMYRPLSAQYCLQLERQSGRCCLGSAEKNCCAQSHFHLWKSRDYATILRFPKKNLYRPLSPKYCLQLERQSGRCGLGSAEKNC